MDLADKYIKFVNQRMQTPSSESAPTWNDFFDEVGIPKRARTDFACACIMKQVKERIR